VVLGSLVPLGSLEEEMQAMADGSLRVLVVEDDQPLAAAVADGLGAGGLHAESALDGRVGLAMARGRRFEVWGVGYRLDPAGG
jgi:CheY-like chemotaxis protein